MEAGIVKVAIGAAGAQAAPVQQNKRNGYAIRIVDSDPDFLGLAHVWDELIACAVDANTFLTHAWLYSWWEAYRPAADLRIVVAEIDGTVHGIAPMMLTREGHLGRLFRRLRFIGDGTSETDHMNFIVRESTRAETLAELLNAVESLRWDIAHLNQMPESSANTVDLLDYASKRGWLVTTTPVPCPRRTLPASYDELQRSLPSRLRTTLRSSRRELEAKHCMEFGWVSTQAQLPGALEVLYRNHGGRWQAKGRSGVFVDERKRHFYERLSSRLLAAENLRFFHLKLDGEVVAQQYCFEHRGTVQLLQEGFDVDYAKLNVGNILRAMVFEHLIGSGARIYDFLAGTSRHKQNWSDSEPNDLNIRLCRRSMRGLAAHHVPQLVERMKRVIKRRGNANE